LIRELHNAIIKIQFPLRARTCSSARLRHLHV